MSVGAAAVSAVTIATLVLLSQSQQYRISYSTRLAESALVFLDKNVVRYIARSFILETWKSE